MRNWRVLVVCPVYTSVPAKAYSSHLGLFYRMGRDPAVELGLHIPHRTQMTKARNMAVDYALGGGGAHQPFDYILWFDDDMLVPADAFHRLAAHNVDVAGALCFKRLPPYTPLLLHEREDPAEPGGRTTTWWHDYPRGRLVKVLGTGFGCILTRTDVFRRLSRPWFVEKEGGAGSDIHFCNMARAAGYAIHVDTSLEVKHLGDCEEVGEALRDEWAAANPAEARNLRCRPREQAHDRAGRRSSKPAASDPFAESGSAARMDGEQ